MVRLGAGWTVLPTMQAEQGDRPLTDGRALMKRRLVLATRRDSVRDPVVDDVAARLRGRSGGAAD
jgi:DNA-binding transcriptional LysR family regulator